MASKVNVRFVVVLSIAVVGILGALLGAAALLLYKSPQELVRLGDQSMARQDYVEAALYYSKACDKERTNPENFRKWKEALSRQQPDTVTKYQAAFAAWRGATRQLAILQRDNIEAKREYLDLFRDLLASPFDRSALAFLKSECDLMLSPWEGRQGGPWDVLRRYRGMALLRIASESPEARQSDWDEAAADLEAALRADPADAESALALEGLYLELAERAAAAARNEETRSLQAKAKAVIDDFLAANPNDPMVLLHSIRRDLASATADFQERARQARASGQAPPDPIAESQAFTAGGLARLEAAFQAIKARGGAKVTPAVISLLRTMENMLDRSAKLSRTEEVIRLGLEARPDDPELLFARAEIAAERQEHLDAVQRLQAIVDRPNPFVGPGGDRLLAMREHAKFLQALWSYRGLLSLDRNADAETYRSGLEKAKAFRQAFVRNEDPNSPRILLVDAWNAYLDGDYMTADRLLTTLNRTSRITDPDTLVLWAQIAMLKQEPGAARERLMTVLQVQPENIAAGLTLGQLSLSLQDFDGALQIFENILRVAPNLEAAQAGKRAAEAGLGRATLEDPVQQVLVDVSRMQREGIADPNTDAAINTRLVEAAQKHNYDPRLMPALVNAQMALGYHDGAKEHVRKALERHPDNRVLQNLKIILDAEDHVEANLRIIDSRTDLPELTRLIGKYQFLRANPGREAQAREVLDRLREIGADNEQVIELQFIDAISRQAWDEAETLARRAATLNLDKADGRTFRARLLAARGETRNALDLMQQVIDADIRTPEVYRLMGRLQQAAGRPADAVQSFRRALALRPNDAAAIRDLVSSLALAGERDQALREARAGEKYAGNDPEFLDLWLKIEAEFGNLAMAIQRRERMAAASPRDRDNLYELGRLYIRTGELDKARTTIDRLRSLADDFDSMALDASWYWAKGDRNGAVKVFNDYVVRLADPAEKCRAHLSFAEFILHRGDRPLAIRALEDARVHQDPANPEADKALAEAHFAFGDLARAEEILRGLVQNAKDTPDHAYRKRLVEALIRQKKVDEAESFLKPLLSVPDPDMITLLLEADLREAQERPREQGQILERVVSKFPGEAAPYIKRGQFLIKSEATRRAGIADLSKAIQLSPAMWQAYRLRAMAYGQEKEVDLALKDLREALRRNPADDEMLVSLLSDLLALGREQEAEDAAMEAIRNRGREAVLYARVADLFMSMGRPRIAAKFFREAFDLSPNVGLGQSLLLALLHPTVADATQADEVLRKLGSAVTQYPGLMMALARTRVIQGRPAEGARAARDAMALLDPGKCDIMLTWHADMDQIIREPAEYLRFLEQMLNAGVAPNLNEWLVFFRAEVISRNEQRRPEAIDLLSALLRTSSNKCLRLYVHRLRGQAAYTLNRSEEAIRFFQEGATEFPDDPELANNIAYLLGKLGRAAEGISFAEQADKATPNNPDILDTLGFLYMQVGRLPDAEQALRRALAYARTPRQSIYAGMHLAETLWKAGKQDEARTLVEKLQQVFDAGGAGIDAVSTQDFAALKSRMQGP
jgi:tetratricopeptide (TPR) repeat protein